MGLKDISTANDPILRASVAAMKRAAELARQVAIETNTAIILWKDGKVVRIPASELRQQNVPIPVRATSPCNDPPPESD